MGKSRLWTGERWSVCVVYKVVRNEAVVGQSSMEISPRIKNTMEMERCEGLRQGEVHFLLEL
jgi:hypothetical protein